MRFEQYFEPTTVSECCQILKEQGADARILAGGTDIVPRLKNKLIKPKAMVGIWNIPELKSVSVNGKGLSLGAAVTLSNIEDNEELEKDYKVIREAAGHVSSMQVRNMATVGGNACNASPSADAIQGLMVMDAMAVIAGTSGTREVPIADFFQGPGKTALSEGEFLVGFDVPAPKANTGAVYKKFTIRGDTDITIVGVGCRLTLKPDGSIAEARLSLAAVAPRPIRALEAEKMLEGKKLTAELIDQIADMTAEGCSPISDQRATKEYRKEMIRVWVRHALKEAEERAKKQ